jgi:hypothetical protein
MCSEIKKHRLTIGGRYERKVNNVDPVKIGIQGYEIKQGLHEGTMTLQLVFANPKGSCDAYADFLAALEGFLETNGYSFKSQSQKETANEAATAIREIYNVGVSVAPFTSI